MEDSLSIHNLASGSSANAMLVRYNGVTGLIDCGLPIRRLNGALADLGASPASIDFVFVTHEHGDHVRSLSELRRLGATIVTSPGTGRALGLGAKDFIPAQPWLTRSLAGIDITPLPVSHDAADPMGVSLAFGQTTVAILTDLGCVSPDLVEPLANAGVVILEANHDVDRVRFGPYPQHLKRRVLSRVGHLSNADCGMTLRSVFEASLRPRVIWLAHLSETNNCPRTAVESVQRFIAGAPVAALPRHNSVDILRPPLPPKTPDIAIQPRLWRELDWPAG